MKRVRITYPGAYHHAMNRGYDGNEIFVGNKKKAQFLDFLEGTAKQLKVHLFAYKTGGGACKSANFGL
jgi:hypothetical protein